MNGDLPTGWAVVELKALVGPTGMFTDGDWILSEHLKSGTDVRLIQLADVGIGQFLNKSRKFISSDTAKMLGVTYLRAGDVLISRMADPLARACIFPQIEKPAITAVDVAIARCDKSVSVPNYLMDLCNSHIVHTQAEEVAVGTTRKRISRKNLEQVRVQLQPLAEQKRIVAKVEKLLEKVDASRARLEKINVLLKRFSQSVLAAACSGRLTADWRGDDFSGDNLPNGWESKTLDSVFTVKTGGTPSRKISAYFENGTIPWVKTGEVQNCDIDQAAEFITKRAVQESNAKVFPAGTLLVAMYGEGKTRGQICRLTFPAATNQACAALINSNKLPTATTRYVFLHLLSQYYALRA